MHPLDATRHARGAVLAGNSRYVRASNRAAGRRPMGPRPTISSLRKTRFLGASPFGGLIRHGALRSKLVKPCFLGFGDHLQPHGCRVRSPNIEAGYTLVAIDFSDERGAALKRALVYHQFPVDNGATRKAYPMIGTTK